MLSFAAVLQAVILTVTLLAPAAISAEEPPVDPPSAPPASEPADPPADPPPADPPAEPPPVEPAEEPAPPPSIMCAATGSELVTTDKFDYAPEETVVITGTGFAADCDVVVRVTRPDGSIVTGDGTFVWGSDTVSTDALGGLVYDYILDGIEGEYLVDMLGADDTVLATTLFADAIPAGTPTIWGDAAATVKQQAFERGDSIYVRLPGAFTAPDITDKYRLQPIQLVSGTTYVFGPMSACLTPNANGIVGAQVAGQEAFSVISANRWKERLYIYPNSGCTGSPTTRDGAETYHVFEAFAFTSSVARDACASDATCGPASPRPIVAPGSTVYLKIGISQASRNFAGFQFIRPDGSAACTIGPLTSDANGAVSIDYPSGICPAIAAAASDIGAWTIKATAVGAAVGGVFAFADSKFNTNIGAFSVKAPLTVTTAVHDAAHADVTNTAVGLGTTVHDTATLGGQVTGLTPAPLTFTVYPNSTCSGTGTPVAAAGAEGAATASVDVGPLAAGDYSFKASVAENASYFGDDSDCEPFSVSMATPTVVTVMHLPDHSVVPSPSEQAFGSSIHDLAIVTGVTGIAPTGTVTYQLFSGSVNCSGPLLSTEIVPVGTESSSTGALPAGRYTYLATYSGDVNYFGPVSAGCEIVETGKGTPTIATEVHAGNNHAVDVQNTALPLGTQVHDFAIVGDVAGIAVTGQVRYELFGNAICEAGAGQPITTETVGVGFASSATAALAAGSYSYLATYLGDSNYRSITADCETFTVEKATPTIVTQVHRDPHIVVPSPSAVPLGSIVHDSAIFGGQVDGFAIDGNVTYTVYRTAFGEPAQNCTGPIFKAAEIVAVGSETTPIGPLATGRYTIRAVYGGNANYLPATAACEIFEVAKATPTIVTEVHRAVTGNAHLVVPSPSEVPLGSIIHDSAIFGGQVDDIVIDGNVTYTVYRTAFGEPAQNCTGPVFKNAEIIAVGSETTPIGPLATGRYTIKAVYGGNGNYTEATAPCEIFEVAKATPVVETVVHRETMANDHTPVANPGVVPLGSTVHDRAFFGGKVDGFDITGTVTFTLFKGAGACTGTIVDGPDVVAIGVMTESPSFGPLTAGRYTYLAHYNGNDNYLPVDAVRCEIFEVPKGETATTTELHEGSRDNVAPHIVIPIGGYTFSPTAHDKATVSGLVTGVPMTGQVRYTFFTNTNPWASVCDGTPRLVEYKTIGAESSDRVDLPPGQYAFRAMYMGDANYAASNSPCEPFTVVPNNAVTSSSLCTFDVDPALDGSQFRLVYTPDMSASVYKLNASNPGQFYYNVFYTGVGGEDVTITIPAPFQTQGAMPVHVYTGVTPVTVDGVTCYTPGTELLGATIDGAPITGTGGGTITVDLPALTGGFAYIAVHVDYGWKKALTGCLKDASGAAICTLPATTIANNTAYDFGFQNGSSGGATVYSINEFKKNPGIGGFTLKAASDDPVALASVEIWLGTKKMATVETDADGWFMWSYKYTGKPATFTVKVPAYALSQSMTLKSNGFLVVNFATP